ncbi:MAG: Rrf2 family transcriptional regulator [Succinivibrio sp.]
MKQSARTSDAVHIMLFMHERRGGRTTSAQIAQSIRTNPACVRLLMSRLREAGLISTARGSATPAMARPLGGITLLDVFRAVEDNQALLRLDTHTNPECGVGVNIQKALGQHYLKVQEAAERQMAAITLEDVWNSFEDLCKKDGASA